MTGIYNADGTIATTTVSGTTLTGLHASDGSINVVLDDSSHTGVYHPCGAFRVNSKFGVMTYDPSGAYYINTIMGAGTTGLLILLTDADGNYLLDPDGQILSEIM